MHPNDPTSRPLNLRKRYNEIVDENGTQTHLSIDSKILLKTVLYPLWGVVTCFVLGHSDHISSELKGLPVITVNFPGQQEIEGRPPIDFGAADKGRLKQRALRCIVEGFKSYISVSLSEETVET
jgi:hypothetical protein